MKIENKKSRTDKTPEILDSSMILHSDIDQSSGPYYITNSVLNEIKDENTRVLVKSNISRKNILVRDPDKKSTDIVKKFADRLGDIGTLSQTDIEVLALAYEKNARILTDDYAIQNVAKEMNIAYLPVVQQGIRSKICWENTCPACGKKYPPGKKVCDICGTGTRKICKANSRKSLILRTKSM